MLYLNGDWCNICLQISGVFQLLYGQHVLIHWESKGFQMGRVKTLFVGLSVYLWPSCHGFIIIPTAVQTTLPHAVVLPIFLHLIYPPSCELCVLKVSSRLHLTSFPSKNKSYVPSPLVKEISKESTFPGKNDLFTAYESLHFDEVLQKWWLSCYKYFEIFCLTSE